MNRYLEPGTFFKTAIWLVKQDKFI